LVVAAEDAADPAAAAARGASSAIDRSITTSSPCIADEVLNKT
jgi:hypothetical protein